MNYRDWLKQFTNYEPITLYWERLSIAEQFGLEEVKAVYDTLFKEAKRDFQLLTELVMVLNHKIFQHHEIPGHKRITEFYSNLWETTDNYACDHLKGDELDYFYNTTD